MPWIAASAIVETAKEAPALTVEVDEEIQAGERWNRIGQPAEIYPVTKYRYLGRINAVHTPRPLRIRMTHPLVLSVLIELDIAQRLRPTTLLYLTRLWETSAARPIRKVIPPITGNEPSRGTAKDPAGRRYFYT